MNVVTVVINGIEYNLKGEEQEEYLHRIASYVDKKVKNVLEINNKLSTSSAAILSAVNVADDMFKIKEQNKKLEKESHEFKKIQDMYEEKVNSLKNQLTHMEEYNKQLQQQLKDYDNGEYSKDKVEERDKQIAELKKKIQETDKSKQRYVDENTAVKSQNKEYQFKVHSLKYKLMDLENKLEENQINLAKERKKKNPLLSDKSV